MARLEKDISGIKYVPAKAPKGYKPYFKYAYKTKVRALSLCKYEPREFKGWIVGAWFDARNMENFYCIKLRKKDMKGQKYPVAVFPESRIRPIVV